MNLIPTRATIASSFLVPEGSCLAKAKIERASRKAKLVVCRILLDQSWMASIGNCLLLIELTGGAQVK